MTDSPAPTGRIDAAAAPSTGAITAVAPPPAASRPGTPAPRPTTPDARRIRSLDVLRGIAILGTLGTNIFVWAQTPAMMAGEGMGAFGPLETMLTQLTNGKFLSLLTIMFGIGLAIQYDAAERRNQRWPAVYAWRGLLLLLDGLLHYVLVFMFDVLMAYAVTGLVVSYLLITSRAMQRVIFAIAASVHLALVTLPLFGVALPFLGTYGVAADAGQGRHPASSASPPPRPCSSAPPRARDASPTPATARGGRASCSA